MAHGQWLAKWKMVVGDKAAVIDETTGRRVTYRELDERADRAANLLRDRFGVGFGDRVAVLGQNSARPSSAVNR